MSRLQIFNGNSTLSLAVGGTSYRFVTVETMIKSCMIQAATSNAGLVTIKDSSGKVLCELSPGRGATFKGDNMDNGTTARFDLSTLYISSTVGGDSAYCGMTVGL